jgi:sRNA-binding carbon storage regulator CsrA
MSELITPNEFIQSDALIKALKDIAKEIENVLTQMGKATDIVKKHYTEVSKGATTIKELTDNEKKKNETSKIGQDIENAVIKVQEKKYKVLIQNSEAVQKVTKELEEETKAQKKNELAQGFNQLERGASG